MSENLEAELAELKRLNPEQSDENLRRALKSFKEQLNYFDDTLRPELDRITQNALKVGQNSNWPPEPFCAMLAEKLLKYSVKFSSDVTQTLLKTVLDERDTINNLKRQ